MSEFVDWYNDKQIEQVVDSLQRNGFLVEVTENRDVARESILAQIPENSTIGFGGSTTIKEIGLYDYLVNSDRYKVINPYIPGLTREQVFSVRQKALLADYFITGTNAITLEGELVNIDGQGNRVSAIVFGPKKVFLVVGMNKIVKNRQLAIERVIEYSAPINAKRLNLPVPCAETGICTDCDSERRICNQLLITIRQNIKDRIKIFLIKENLGF